MAQKYSCSRTNKGRKFTMGSRFPQFCTFLHFSRSSLQWNFLREWTCTTPQWTCDHVRWQHEMTTGPSAVPFPFTGCPWHAVSPCRDASSFLCSKHSVIHHPAFPKGAFSLLPFNIAIGLSVTVLLARTVKNSEEGSRRLQGKSWPCCPEGKQYCSALTPVILGLLCQHPHPTQGGDYKELSYTEQVPHICWDFIQFSQTEKALPVKQGDWQCGECYKDHSGLQSSSKCLWKGHGLPLLIGKQGRPWPWWILLLQGKGDIPSVSTYIGHWAKVIVSLQTAKYFFFVKCKSHFCFSIPVLFYNLRWFYCFTWIKEL